VPRLILRLAPLENVEPPPARNQVVRLPDADQPGSAQASSASARPEPTPQEPTAPEPEAVTPSPQNRSIAQSGWLASTAPLRGWSAAVASSQDACFVLDSEGVVVSVSAAGIDLLGSGDRVAMGHHILDVIDLVDLESGASDPEYAPRITPLVVLRSPGLARSLMRVRHPDGAVVTLDSSSAPIHDEAGQVLGSMTFISPIRAR
jgi:PAS domain S-box-containing protein